MPFAVESLDQQANRALKLLRSKSSSFEKYIFMSQLRNNNIRVFYKIVNDHIQVIFFFFSFDGLIE